MSNFPQNTSDSGYFDSTYSFSAAQNPNFHNETPVSRKRKASCIEHHKQNVSEVMEYYSPPFSSTLNDSLLSHLEQIHLENEHEKGSTAQTSRTESSNKLFKPNDNRKFCSVPNTPESQVKYNRDSITKANTNSFIKNFTQFGMQSQSPLNKEAYNILYPEIPSLERKKPGTPMKSDIKFSNQAKKFLFYAPRQNLLKQIVSNYVIMNKILKNLSNGDLYRLTKVSTAFKDAVLKDIDASSRFSEYTIFYKDHKENYRITPPASPEKESGSDTEIEASPGSKNFVDFYQMGKVLTMNQSLIKCPKCQKPSVVENDIAQCQNINRCGYIYCKKCESFANNPKTFKDKCNNAKLLNTTRSRNQFGDLSNCTGTSDYMTDISSSIFSSSFSLNMSNKYDSSGIFSDCEVSTPKQNVRRNLSKSFMIRSEVKIFSSSNAQVHMPQPKKISRRTSLVPVVPNEPTKTNSEIMEGLSPPQVQHSACSKQSKRNLKRLTR